MEIELGPAKQDEKRPNDGKDDACRMKRSPFFRPHKQVRNQSADERTDDPEPYGPKQRQMDVHDRLRDESGD
jgi:hypothetical protein